MAKRSMPNFDIGVAEGAAHRIEDITLYKNVKLSKDIIGEDGEVLGDGPENVSKG
jgi:hypothetical protein